MNKKRNVRNIILYITIPILLIVAIVFLFRGQDKESYTYKEIIDLFQEKKVHSFVFDGSSGDLEITLFSKKQLEDIANGVYEEPEDTTDEEEETTTQSAGFWDVINGEAPTEIPENEQQKVIKTKVAFPQTFMDDIKYYKNGNMIADYDLKSSATQNQIISMIPNFLTLALMAGVMIYFFRKMSGGFGSDSGKQTGFGKAKIKNIENDKKKTTFDDVAGADEEKEELSEIVEFLKAPKRFNELGARIPKGVLLVGPPGTGKTLLARAVAGEAGVPFFSISGSDFVEMFVGVGASRVRDLFDQAKKNSPCIIFIDEIDAVGRQRGTGLGGGHDEREQTLNQLLVEMDGFGINEGIIIIAATNRPDILDPALMRPGRFDRQVVVGYPDVKGREAILKVHAKDKPLSPDVKLSVIAKSTAGFTGADLENLLNEAALLSARRGRKAITMEEIEEATIKVVVGTEKKSRVMSDKEKRLTAYHEAGHAIAFYACESQDPVHQISIIPRGMAGGFTMPLPSEDKSYNSREEMKEDIVVALSGRVAEALVLGDISTGASNDIERATKVARNMVTKYGMSDSLGPIAYGASEGGEIFLGRDMGHVKDYSEKVASQIDDEVHGIVDDAYKRSETILKAHMTQLHEVAKFLIKHEKMDGQQFEQVMNGTFVEPVEEPEDE